MVSIHFIKTFFAILLHMVPILLPLILAITFIGLWIGRRESWSCSEALYFAFITATTVGYGDFHPSHSKSRFAAILIAFIGVLFTGIIVAVGLHALQISIAEKLQWPPNSTDSL